MTGQRVSLLSGPHRNERGTVVDTAPSGHLVGVELDSGVYEVVPAADVETCERGRFCYGGSDSVSLTNGALAAFGRAQER